MAWYSFITDPFGQKTAASNLESSINTANSQNNNESIPQLQQRLSSQNNVPVSNAAVQSSTPAISSLDQLEQQAISNIPSGPSSSELDAAFSPLFQSLSEAESNRRAEATEASGMIDKYRTEDLAALEKNRSGLDESIKTESQELYNTRTSALSEARRALSGLKQQAMAGFGAGSSTGGAVMELAGEQFARNQGQIEQLNLTNQRKLSEYALSVRNYYDQEETRIRRESESQMMAIQQQLRQSLEQISSQRYSLQSQKQQAQMNLVQQAREAVAEIKNQVLSQKINLQVWREQQNEMLNQAYTSIKSQEVDVPTNLFDDTLASNITSIGSTSKNTYSPAIRSLINNDDEYADLIYTA